MFESSVGAECLEAETVLFPALHKSAMDYIPLLRSGNS